MTWPRRLTFDLGLLGATLLLLTWGVMMVFSASAIMAGDKYQQPFYFMIQQLIGAGIGLAIIFFLMKVKKTFFLQPMFVYSLLAFNTFLLILCFLMPTVANTNRWVMLFGLRFQPSELTKVSIILFLAIYCDKNRDRINELKVLAIPFTILAINVLLVLMEPDFGSAFLIFCLGAMILYMAGIKTRYFLIVGLIFCLLFGFTLCKAQYRVERIQGFLSGEKDLLGSGYQVNQSKLAIGSGGLVGNGIGQSTQKLYFLPFAHTDFIYAIIGEEIGLLGTMSILILYLVLLWRGLSISLAVSEPALKMIAAGLTLAIVFQAFTNITVVLGLGPTKGTTLPFISYGRSALICSLTAIGILLHISQKRWAVKHG